MPLSPRASVAILLLSLGAAIQAAEPAAAGREDWKLFGKNGDITIYTRVRPGSPLKEFKAVAPVDAPPRAVLGVIDDVADYPRFMPYVDECHIIKREPGAVVSYQRISPPFCMDRDYTIRVWHETKPGAAGPAYICRWNLANALGPGEQAGVVRIKINEGGWLIEPAGSGTRVTYDVYADGASSLPAFLVDKANQIAINKLFEAIRKRVKEVKYTALP